MSECALKRLLEQVAVLHLEIIMIIIRPLPTVEIARLSCVHKNFKLAWDALRAATPQARVFSPYISRSVFDPPTATAMEWISTLPTRNKRAIALGDLVRVKTTVRSRVSLPLMTYALVTDQVVVFETFASASLETSPPWSHRYGFRDGDDYVCKLYSALAKAAYDHGANACLEWLLNTKRRVIGSALLSAMICEATRGEHFYHYSDPFKIKSPIKPHLPLAIPNMGAIDILYRRWNVESLQISPFTQHPLVEFLFGNAHEISIFRLHAFTDDEYLRREHENHFVISLNAANQDIDMMTSVYRQRPGWINLRSPRYTKILEHCCKPRRGPPRAGAVDFLLDHGVVASEACIQAAVAAGLDDIVPRLRAAIIPVSRERVV
jgi:hypothetical protein